MAQFTAPDLNQTRLSVRQEFEVEVEQPPRLDQIKFTSEPGLESLRLGENVKIRCHYEKEPHESHPLVQLQTEGATDEASVVLKNVSELEQINCKVSNSAGSATTTLTIRAKYPPKVVAFERDINENLVCQVKGDVSDGPYKGFSKAALHTVQTFDY